MRRDLSTDHLAIITPIDGPRRVLSLWWKLFGNACIIATPLVMAVLPIAVGAMMIPLFGPRIGILITLAAIGGALTLQIAWAMTYPEWPINQWSYRRLLRLVAARELPLSVRQWVAASPRMVEFVPRENWKATKLDTADDVMLIHVDQHGVHLEGERARYEFPPGSIIDVAVESIRPSGCFHPLHFVVLTVRGADGPLEFPLGYRDHSLGTLRSSVRHQQSQQLCHQIAEIATGGDMTYLDTPHPVSRPLATGNPYAAPRF